MSKSTQDLCLWLRDFSHILKDDSVCIQIYKDKSFRIIGSDNVILYDSDEESEGSDRLDLNDLPYENPRDFFEMEVSLYPKDPKNLEDPSYPDQILEAEELMERRNEHGQHS